MQLQNELNKVKEELEDSKEKSKVFFNHFILKSSPLISSSSSSSLLI